MSLNQEFPDVERQKLYQHAELTSSKTAAQRLPFCNSMRPHACVVKAKVRDLVLSTRIDGSRGPDVML